MLAHLYNVQLNISLETIVLFYFSVLCFKSFTFQASSERRLIRYFDSHIVIQQQNLMQRFWLFNVFKPLGGRGCHPFLCDNSVVVVGSFFVVTNIICGVRPGLVT